MAARKRSKDRERMAAEIASSLAALPEGEGGYELSAAFSTPERRRISGLWTVVEHRAGGRPYVEAFAEKALRGAPLRGASYACAFDFRESVCVKRARISGIAELPDGPVDYLFAMSVAISWELGRGCLLVRPEMGYQTTSLGGAPAAVKELAASGALSRVAYRFEEGRLVLEEEDDLKLLERPSEAPSAEEEP